MVIDGSRARSKVVSLNSGLNSVCLLILGPFTVHLLRLRQTSTMGVGSIPESPAMPAGETAEERERAWAAAHPPVAQGQLYLITSSSSISQLLNKRIKQHLLLEVKRYILSQLLAFLSEVCCQLISTVQA